MKRLSILFALLLTACMQPSYPGIDHPSGGGNSANDRSIIDYIDQRLSKEYYWLDEVEEKYNSFNRNLSWDKYLQSSLSLLKTNTDDGYIANNGQRVFYSYIRDIGESTRGAVTGFGIELHYTIVIIDQEQRYYGFVIENVFDGSPAAEAGIKRGDVITMIDGAYITPNNYASRFSSIENNTAKSLKLQLRRQTGDKESYKATLSPSTYSETTVVYNRIVDIEEKRIGYLVYTGFESEYDDEFLAILDRFASDGVNEVILDLRCNGGGSVTSAVKLCSALLPSTYEDGVLCTITRHPKNTSQERTQQFILENTSNYLQNLTRLTVICSDYSASASELVIMGLRGLDFQVDLIGTTTEGKNCGMDVTRRTIGGKTLEYAPITFMCFNAKGVGDWGYGIAPDIDLTDKSNKFGIRDSNYPIPRTDWGDEEYDIGLASALAHITGKSISAIRAMPLAENALVEPTIELERPTEGIRLYHEE